MKVVLVKENNTVRILEGKGSIGSNLMAMRSRLTGGDVMYYELDYDASLGMRLEAYIEALNKFPKLLNESKMIKSIS